MKKRGREKRRSWRKGWRKGEKEEEEGEVRGGENGGKRRRAILLYPGVDRGVLREVKEKFLLRNEEWKQPSGRAWMTGPPCPSQWPPRYSITVMLADMSSWIFTCFSAARQPHTRCDAGITGRDVICYFTVLAPIVF